MIVKNVIIGVVWHSESESLPYFRLTLLLLGGVPNFCPNSALFAGFPYNAKCLVKTMTMTCSDFYVSNQLAHCGIHK